MERLILVCLVLAGGLVSCSPEGKDRFDSWNADFSNSPDRFGRAVTALWIARYEEEAGSGRFLRSTAWGEVPEKLVPDGQGGFTVAVPLLLQSETSDGPQPDRFWTVLVRVVREGNRFSLDPNEALPGEVTGWHDVSHRTVWFRGRSLSFQGPQIRWQFQGRY